MQWVPFQRDLDPRYGVDQPVGSGLVDDRLERGQRLPTLDVVAEPLPPLGKPADQARDEAATLVQRLNIPERPWCLSPTIFPGGAQPRVNLARDFAHDYPALLLDELTASLDTANREVVLALIEEAKGRGAAILGIFHDEAARARVCDRLVDVGDFTPGLAA